MKFISLVYVFALIILSGIEAKAQRVLSLEQCIKIAQNNSLDIKKGVLAKEGASINLKFSKQQLLPSLNANSSLSYNVGRRIDPTTNSYLSQSFISQGINLNSGITLYNGGRLRKNIKKAIFDKNASEEDIEQMRRDIALLVTNTYLSILFAQESLKNLENQYKSTKEQLVKLNKLIDAGLKPKSASLSMEAQLLSDEQKLVAGNNELERNYLNLKNLLLLEDSERVEIKTPIIDMNDNGDNIALSLSELYVSALQHYPGYSAAEYRLKSSLLQRDIAKASFLPSVSLGGGLSTNYANRALEVTGYDQKIRESIFIINNQEVNVGIPFSEPITRKQIYVDQLKNNLGFGMALQVNIPIYNKYSSRAGLDRAKISIENQKIAKEQIAQNIKSKIQLAFADSKAAKSQYLASKKAFEAQKAAFDNAKLQYDVGGLGSYDLINAKLLFEKAQNSLLLSKYQYIFKSKILDYYLGENLSFN